MKTSISKFIFLVLSTTIIASSMLFSRVKACTCVDLSFCDNIRDVDIVLQGIVVAKSEQVEINEDNTYRVLGTVIKPESPNLVYSERFSFTAAGNSSLCGVDLDLHKRYLLGLYRDENFNFSANSCGLVKRFDINADNNELYKCLQDNCGFSCGVAQAHLDCPIYPINHDPGVYCASTCKGVTCRKGEECTIAPQLCRGGISGCPPPAVCIPEKQ